MPGVPLGEPGEVVRGARHADLSGTGRLSSRKAFGARLCQSLHDPIALTICRS